MWMIRLRGEERDRDVLAGGSAALKTAAAFDLWRWPPCWPTGLGLAGLPIGALPFRPHDCPALISEGVGVTQSSVTSAARRPRRETEHGARHAANRDELTRSVPSTGRALT